MDFLTSEPVIAALIGAFGGILLGLAARLGRFCTLGAIEDALYGGSTIRLRMWALAIGVAVLGSFALLGLGWLDPMQPFYLSQRFSPLASILGGLTFGYGMALAGNCGFGAVARLGGGDLRSFVIVLVMGVSAYVTLSGPLGPLRIWVFGAAGAAAEPAGLAHGLGGATGLPPVVIGISIGFLICIGALWRSALARNPALLFWSIVVGFAVVSGWAGTAYLARTGFDGIAVVSHTFAAPAGDAILFAMLSSGMSLSFAIGSVAGVWVGAFVGSLIKGHFRWEACEDPRELRRQIFGAGLMGVGAVVASGCTIGQGISAFSLLSYSAPVTLAAIFVGCAVGLRQLIEGFHSAAE